MAKIGTAHVEIKPVLNKEALDAIKARIEAEVAAALLPSPSMGRDHDRAILEGAEGTDRRVVVVRCPHTIGLCYLQDHGGEVGEMLGNLPCPCNDRSEIVGEVVEVARPSLSIPPTPIVPLEQQP